MTTEARIHANRLNAQKSTGPNTPQGKAAVSQNALKHGLSARHDVITTESQADFDLHRDSLLAELAPQGPMESILADRIVSLSWRLKRADQIQNQAFDAMHEKNTTGPLANLAKSFGLKGLGLPQDETSDSRPDLILGRIAIKDFSNARVLDRLLMYERRIEHSLYKTTLELQRLRLLRNLEPSQPNLEPEDRRLSPARIPIRREPIINNQSSIVNIEKPPEPPQNHPTSTIEYPESSIEYPESGITAQNKANFKMGNMNISPARTKAYANKQRTMSNKRHSKQTQSNPILSRRSPERSRIPAAPPGQNPALSGVEGTRYEIRFTPAPRGKYEIQTLTNPSIYCSG